MKPLAPLALFSAVLLSACASGADAPMAKGEWRPLNPAQFDVSPSLVTVPELPKITESDKS